MTARAHRLLIGCALALTCMAFQDPLPRGHVTDLAGVLETETSAALEEQLRAYAERTSIEVAVATVESLDGTSIEQYAHRLFNEWGVGSADYDNGVLLLVAPNERKVRIEVGYGLEAYLTDAASSRVIHRAILPAFKAGDVSGGIQDGVSGIVTTLGGSPWADRVERRRFAREAATRRKAERAAAVGAFFVQLATLLAGLAALACLGLLMAWARTRYRGWTRRRSLRRSLRAETIPEMERALDTVRREVEVMTQRAKRTVRGPAEIERIAFYRTAADTQITATERIIEAARAMVDPDPDGAHAALRENGANVLVLARAQVGRIEKEIAGWTAARDAYPGLREEAMSRVTRAESTIARVRANGYRVEGASERLNAVAPRLTEADALFQEGDPAGAAQQLRRASNHADDAFAAAAYLPATRDEVAAATPTLRAQLIACREAILDAKGTALARLSRDYPAEVVAPVLAAVAEAEPRADEVARLLTSAEAMNSMETQKFEEAEGSIERARDLLQNLTLLSDRPHHVLQEQIDAERALPDLLEDIAAVEGPVAATCAHADVPSPTRRECEDARAEINAMKRVIAAPGPKDWVVLVAAARALRSTFSRIRRAAQTAIDQADRRRREEDARRRREEESRRRRQRQAASMSSYGSGGGGGSSFGGFGGGSSGGGGASGSW